jgi:tRNA1(Val) A37 N6-methylase TrmN6
MKQQNLPFLAKIKEIIKENGKFFVVHEPLTQCVDDLKKKSLSLTDIANIGKQMIEISLNLMKEGVTLAELRPEFYFVNRKRVKLAHIVSLSSDEEKE